MRGKLVLACLTATAMLQAEARHPPPFVGGRITLIDRGNRPAEDVGQAVAWLTASAPVAALLSQRRSVPKRRNFHPTFSSSRRARRFPFRITIRSITTSFRSPVETPFDLGLYSRGQARSVTFSRPGIIRVYCNVHAQMSAIVVVRDNPYFTQPASDGTFNINGVPPGKYVLHVWHERAVEVTRDAGRARDSESGISTSNSTPEVIASSLT